MERFKKIELVFVEMEFRESRLKVGRLALNQNKIWFEYHPEFKLEISPFMLPVSPGVKPCKSQPFDGLFGVFNDSLPDGWGKLLLDRSIMEKGIPHQSLSPLDRLAFVGANGMGALTYKPDYGEESQDQSVLNLSHLADEIEQIIEGESGEVLHELYEMGGSSAGARPKVVVAYDSQNNQIQKNAGLLPKGFEHWLIKFQSRSDIPDMSKIEYAYSVMAKAAGIEMSETKLFQGVKSQSWFGTKRFDREGDKRVHMHTISGLLHASHRIPSLDYAVLMNCALELENNIKEAEKLFRLACFNVFAHNRDDHGKNFSFLMNEKGQWKFSPAYDLTFSYGPGGQHCTTILKEGANPSRQNLINLAKMFSLNKGKQIIEEVRDAISQWSVIAGEIEISRQTTKLIQKEMNKIE